MRYPDSHKARTRQKILDGAAALFRREGYGGAGIDRIMAAADLTRGSFYAHFRSKAALFAEVLRRESDMVRRLRRARDAREVIAGYLDPANRERVGRGCSLASLSNDVPRRDRAAKRAFAEQVETLISEFESRVVDARGSDEEAFGVGRDARARAVEAVALCVGGINLARGIADESLAREVLEVCRDRACEAIAPRPTDS